MGKSNYLEAALVNHVLGNQPFSAPSTVYVALHTADPADDGSGAEVSGNAYARVAVTNNNTNWPDGNPKSNGVAIEFPTPTGSWGAVTHWAAWDAATNGNLLYHGTLTVPKTLTTDDDVTFAIGSLVVTED